MGSHEPLHIRAYLRTGVVADKYLPLDGILYYQAVRNVDGPQILTIPGGHPDIGHLQFVIPLKREKPRSDPGWYYRCSWAQWSHDVEGRDYWNKRFDSHLSDLIDFGNKRGKVIIEAGRYKAYHMPVFYRAALWVEWYCLGDADLITYLLSCITHIGKKGSQGWGRVIWWDVKPCADDWSVWRDGKLMRGIPAGDMPEGAVSNLQHYGIRPSYWLPQNQMMLVVPSP